MAITQISVQATFEFMHRTDEIAGKLKEAGMTVEDQIKPIGHFTGTVDSTAIDKLKSIEGVASVKIIGQQGAKPPDDYTIS